MTEGFTSLRTALIRQNPHILTVIGKDAAEESLLLPSREMCLLLQDGIGKYPEFLSRMVLSYAVGRKAQELSPMIRKLACVYVDEREYGASMTVVIIIIIIIIIPRFHPQSFLQATLLPLRITPGLVRK